MRLDIRRYCAIISAMAARGTGAMHVAKIVRPYKDRVYVYHFVRQTYREDGRVKHRTLANLSHLPPAVIELVRRALAGDPLALEAADGPLEVRRSLPHGHVAAVLGMLRSLGLETLLGPGPGRAPALVGGGGGSAAGAPDELYTALDWLLGRQPAVEAALAARHLGPGSLVLYDVSSTYVTGRACELAAHGYSRDHRADREQVVFGLVCDPAGRPLAVEAFPGNPAAPATLETALDKLQRTFGLSDIVLAGDRGMLTSARIERLKERGGIGWISALRGAPRPGPRRVRARPPGGVARGGPAERLPAPSVVTAYKSLAHAERAFRNLKTVELEVRPIYHYKADRVRAHLFVCLLAGDVGGA